MGARGKETSAVHRGGEPVATKLHRIAEKARKEPGFKFTSLYHLMKFLAHRIEDKRIQRMVKRFLRAGVAEDGSVTINDEGTPQGVVISPLLVNIYLRYTLDLWFEKIYRKSCRGYVGLIRY